MTGFWEAAERVRNGTAADAAPRTVSVFEADVTSRTDWNEAADFEKTVPLADDQPADRAMPRPRTATPVAPLREDSPAQTVQAVTPSAATPPSLPEPRSETLAPPVAATPPSPAMAAPARETPALPVVAVPAPPNSPAPVLAASPATPAPSERVQSTPAAEPPASAPATIAMPAPEAWPAATAVVMVEAVPHHHPAPVPPTHDAPAPPVEAPAPPPLSIHIDRIEIHIDPPRPPAAAPVRRAAPAPAVDLNDYLARRAR